MISRCKNSITSLVLSPTLFIIVMDSLLKHLKALGQSLCIHGLDVGSSAHVDDIRASSNFTDATHVQGNCIKAFCAANSLTLNASKTEAVKFYVDPFSPDTIQVAGTTIDTQSHAKCLGVWWQHDLSPCWSVEENISKACRAFFGLGFIGSFRGVLNPLTGLSVFEVFVVPILLYGYETWILTPTLLYIKVGETAVGNRKTYSETR